MVDFYNNLARESPHKKASVLINKTRTQIRYLENSLATCFKQFKDAYPNIRLSQSAFESVRPKNIKLHSQATRQVCCCQTHVNIDYLRQTLNLMLRANDRNIVQSNEDLVNLTLCKEHNLKCIEQRCDNCGVHLLNRIRTSPKFCSIDCK